MLNSHFFKLCLSLSPIGAEVNTGRIVNVPNCLHNQFHLFAERFVLFGVHLILENTIDHHNLTCVHCFFDFGSLFFYFFPPLSFVLFSLFQAHSADKLHKFLLFSLPTLDVPFSFVIRVIVIFLQFFMFFLSSLMLCFVVLAFLSFIEEELFHSVFKNVEKRILGPLLNGRLFHQL